MRHLLEGKNSKERSEIKAKEIAKLNFVGVYENTEYGLKIEILKIGTSISKGIISLDVFARAWKNGKQLGFGSDGSIDIERFRFYNPPILIDDPNGDIIKEWKDEITGKIKQRKLREDLEQATKDSLAHTIHVSGKDNGNIIEGSIGNTTSTFYPDPSPETTSVDGTIRATADATWATVRDAATGASAQPGTSPLLIVLTQLDGTYLIYRGFFHFDTSALPDGDTISAATISFAGTGTIEVNQPNTTLEVVASTTASDNALTTADYDQIGSTSFASMNISSWVETNNTYNNLSLNASGIAAISKTGVSKFATRTGIDLSNTPPGTGEVARIEAYCAENAGTTSDPKLVVTHTTVHSISVNDTVTIAESVNRDFILQYSVNDSITVVAKATKTTENTLLDTLTLTTAPTTAGNYNLTMQVIDPTPPKTFEFTWNSVSTGVVAGPWADVAFLPKSINGGVAGTLEFDDLSSPFGPPGDTTLYTDVVTVVLGDSANVTLIHNINVNDSVTVSEAKTVEHFFNITVNEAPVITESVTATNTFLGGINVNDAITVSESVVLTLIHNPTVNDSITISESVNRDFILQFSTSDLVTVSETIKIEQLLDINKSETIIVSESVSMLLILNINKSENITVTESVNTDIINNPTVNDSVTVSESVNRDFLLQFSASDTVTVSETIKIEQLLDINKFESITVSESVSMNLMLDISKNETVTASENIAVSLVLDVIVNDTITVSETVNRDFLLQFSVSDTIAVSESVTINLMLDISKSETVTISESVTVTLFLSPSVSDSITVSEGVGIQELLDISKNETVTISENVTVDFLLQFSTSDTVTVSESVTINLILNPSVSDAVTISENITVNLILNPTVNDSITVSENIGIQELLDVLKNETVTVSENIGIQELLDISKNETVTISESVTINLILNPTVNDSITISESVVLTLFLEPMVADTITISETIKIEQLIDLSKSESVTVSENIAMGGILDLSVNDSVSVSESAPGTNLFLNPNINDSVALTEGITTSGQLYISVNDSVTASESVTIVRHDVRRGTVSMRSKQQSYPLAMDIKDIL